MTTTASRPLPADALPQLEAPPRLAVPTALLKARISAGIEREVAALHRLDWRRRTTEIGFFAMLWLLGAITIRAGLAHPEHGGLAIGARIFGSVLAAIAINACVLLLHEGMHHTLWAGRRANTWGSRVLGTIVLMSFRAYKVMHLRHHAFLGDPRDPDDYHNYTDRRGLLWLLHWVRLLAGTWLYLVLIPFIAWRFASRSARQQIVLEYGLMALAYLALALLVPQWLLIHCWLLPGVLVAYWTQLRGLIEHGFADHADPLGATRTMMPHPALALLILQINLHLEHHLYPKVPSYNLPALHRLLWPRLPRVVAGRSYLAFLLQFLGLAVRLGDEPIGLRTRQPAGEA
jgi:fatty acid desaturase